MTAELNGTSRATRPVRIGTRGSALALWQAREVQSLLRAAHPDVRFEIEVIRSEGDVDKASPLTQIGGRGVFTSALQQALLAGTIDMAVHSTKDLPSLSPPGIAIAAYPQRETPQDALVSRDNHGLDALPANPVIGTSSRRRSAQIKAIRADARIKELRGNIDTRLQKGRSSDYDGVILAAAGLHRMEWSSEISELLTIDRFTPAPGQGALAIETRLDPDPAWSLARALNDERIQTAVQIERAFLRGVGGGCTTPVGAYAMVERTHGIETVRLWAMLASDDEVRLERAYEEFAVNAAEQEAFALAGRILRTIAPAWIGVTATSTGGKTVLATGAAAQVEALRAVAPDRLEVLHAPMIEIEPVADGSRMDAAVTDACAGSYDWLVLTSANAVPPLVARLQTQGCSLQARIAVVGTPTAEALAAHGVEAELVPEEQHAEGLARTLRMQAQAGQRVVCLLSDRARPVLADRLREAGLNVDVVDAYRTVSATTIDSAILTRIRNAEIDAVTFTSPSAVQAFTELVAVDLPALSGAAFVAIGSTTAKALRDADLPVHAEAETPSATGLLAALDYYLGTDAVGDQRSEGTSR